tara:strand:+ start:311 stop:610 length:300 start_codon:yes stop_codon:yes gene_type:complete
MNDHVNATMAGILNSISRDLAADNLKAAKVQEARMESLLRGYIENAGKQYQYGGLTNLLTTLASIMEEKQQSKTDDFARAVVALEDCARDCDLKYEVLE